MWHAVWSNYDLLDWLIPNKFTPELDLHGHSTSLPLGSFNGRIVHFLKESCHFAATIHKS